MFDKRSKNGWIVTSTAGVALPMLAPDISSTEVRSRRRRRISPEAGHALEILGHAIEYLADEYVHAGAPFFASDPRLAAIQLLMKCNREVYFACPEVPSFWDRVRSLLHLH